MNPEEFAQILCDEVNVERFAFYLGPVQRQDGTIAKLTAVYTAVPYFEKRERRHGTFDLELDNVPQSKPDLAREMFKASMSDLSASSSR